jgi:hypothetical protein
MTVGSLFYVSRAEMQLSISAPHILGNFRLPYPFVSRGSLAAESGPDTNPDYVELASH